MASPDDHNEAQTRVKAPWFRTTSWTNVLLARRKDFPEAKRALEKLCCTYWYPLYGYIRQQGHSPHDAQDLTQDFFALLLEKNYLEAVDRKKGKFRSFLLVALNHYLSDARKRARAAKRGGGQMIISLDEQTAEDRYSLEPATDLSPEKAFERRWAQTLLETARARLQEEFIGARKLRLFDELKGFLADEADTGDYDAVASRLGMTVGAVSVAVHRMRQRYRELVRAEIVPTLGSPADIDGEMQHLFSVLKG